MLKAIGGLTLLSFILIGCGTSAHWKNYSYHGFSLDCPYPLAYDRAAGGVFAVKTENEGNGIKDDFYLSASLWKKDAGFDLKKFSEGLSELNRKKIKTYHSVLKSVTCSGLPAIMEEAAYTAQMKPLKMKILEVQKGRSVFVVVIVYHDNDRFESMANRIVDSFKILN